MNNQEKTYKVLYTCQDADQDQKESVWFFARDKLVGPALNSWLEHVSPLVKDLLPLNRLS